MGADRPVTPCARRCTLDGQSPRAPQKEVLMRRALALVALSLFASLAFSLVATLLTRPEMRSSVFEAVNRRLTGESEEEVST
jgi:hypothetical protein